MQRKIRALMIFLLSFALVWGNADAAQFVDSSGGAGQTDSSMPMTHDCCDNTAQSCPDCECTGCLGACNASSANGLHSAIYTPISLIQCNQGRDDYCADLHKIFYRLPTPPPRTSSRWRS